MACKRKEPATDLQEQFQYFASMMDTRRDGTTINLCRADYWLIQANILDHRKVTLADTGISFSKFVVVIEPPPQEPTKRKSKKNQITKQDSTTDSAGKKRAIIRKDEIDYDQWLKFLKDLCIKTNLCLRKCKEQLIQCGLPGHKAPPIRPYYYYIPRRKWPNDIILYEDTTADINDAANVTLAV